MEITKTASRTGNILNSARRNICGFTLVEILIVVTVIGVAAAFVAPKLFAKSDQVKKEAVRLETASIMEALSNYKLDNELYPTPQQGLAALIKKPKTAPLPPAWKEVGYLDKMPLDPWNQPYQYRNPGIHGDVDVFSLGADGMPGGTGENADIGSWD